MVGLQRSQILRRFSMVAAGGDDDDESRWCTSCVLLWFGSVGCVLIVDGLV